MPAVDNIGWKKRMVSIAVFVSALVGGSLLWGFQADSNGYLGSSHVSVNDYEFLLSVEPGDGSIDLELVEIVYQQMLMRIESLPAAKVVAEGRQVAGPQTFQREVKVSGLTGRLL